MLGGNGYINDYPTGRLLRDAQLYRVGAGTQEIRRCVEGLASRCLKGADPRTFALAGCSSDASSTRTLGSRDEEGLPSNAVLFALSVIWNHSEVYESTAKAVTALQAGAKAPHRARG